MPEPFFSVCVPVFNGEKFVASALHSIRNQTLRDFEVIAIDNASTDGTWKVLNDAIGTDSRIRLLRNDSNLGMHGNLNRCLRESRGNWIGILPADDRYRLEALETIHGELSGRADAVMWMHSHLCVGGQQTDVPIVWPRRMEMDCSALAKALYLRGNIFGELSSWFVRRDTVGDEVFGDYPLTLDLRFWTRIAHRAAGKVAIYWPEPLAVVTIHNESASSKAAQSGESIPDVIDAAADLSTLGWSASTRLRQAARLIWCQAKFFRQLPKGRRYVPLKAAWRVLRARP
jgi:glycosyltransferase involved in cell wall biosynthesis